MTIDVAKYPATWKFTHNRGYGGGWDVPCRVVNRGSARVQIAALMRDGSEKLVWVSPRKLVEKCAANSSERKA